MNMMIELPKEKTKMIYYDNFNRVRRVEYPQKGGGVYNLYVEYGNRGYLVRNNSLRKRIGCKLNFHESLSHAGENPHCIHCGNRFYYSALGF